MRSILLLLSGNAFASLMLLVRNLLVSRLIGVEDYGIAATFAVAMAVIEMASQLGLQQMIVQDKAGEDPKLQAGLQGFQVLRGVVGAAVLVAIAYPLAAFLGIPEVAWAYQVMALVPLANGFLHFDVFRFNRRMAFGPLLLTETLPALVSVLAVWPFVQIWGDYRVMLFALLVQWGLRLVMSHLVAERRYRLSFDRAVMGRGFSFGWPLLLNGALLFLVFHGEKLIVGRELGMAPLAIFAMGVTLTLTPTLVVAKSAQAFFLPQLSKARGTVEFAPLAHAALQTSLLCGLVLVLGVMALGGPFVWLVLGEKYAALVPLLTWLAILMAVRVFKGGGADVALALGQTVNAMVANLFRVASLPLSWWVVAEGGDLVTVIWIATLAEAFGYGAALVLVWRRAGVGLGPVLLPVALSFAALGAAALQAAGIWPAAWMGVAASAALALAAGLTMAALRRALLARRG